ncbi:MAG: AbrB/MazE/SpoVT family DNA-binding domain-containing protein [bacterium]|nr:AbrB/MazE/SpoVT family DNA-binding domain-containing protein [bacterium]
MKISTLSSKNQITLPKETLFYLGIKPKDKIIIEIRNKEIVLSSMKTSVVAETAGTLNQYVATKKLNKSLHSIMKSTKKKTAYHLAVT